MCWAFTGDRTEECHGVCGCQEEDAVGVCLKCAHESGQAEMGYMLLIVGAGFARMMVGLILLYNADPGKVAPPMWAKIVFPVACICHYDGGEQGCFTAVFALMFQCLFTVVIWRPTKRGPTLPSLTARRGGGLNSTSIVPVEDAGGCEMVETQRLERDRHGRLRDRSNSLAHHAVGNLAMGGAQQHAQKQEPNKEHQPLQRQNTRRMAADGAEANPGWGELLEDADDDRAVVYAD